MQKLLRYSDKDIQDIKMDEWLERKPEVLRPIAIRWFDVIKACGPDVEDIFHDYYPMGCVDRTPFAYVNVFQSHVNVGFFYGTELEDTSGLMEGTGKLMRHIKLRPGEEVDEKAIEALIKAAYADIKRRLNQI
ncbi:MAG: DUF1801 domain-containing protein [Cyclobacteriaceae bacterium]|nr:DUF1801 domain-containing protein [Cyclobacteriaceae bacterium]